MIVFVSGVLQNGLNNLENFGKLTLEHLFSAKESIKYAYSTIYINNDNQNFLNFLQFK